MKTRHKPLGIAIPGLAVLRLDFEFGPGDWGKDKWIGHKVKVSVSLGLSVIPD